MLGLLYDVARNSFLRICVLCKMYLTVDLNDCHRGVPRGLKGHPEVSMCRTSLPALRRRSPLSWLRVVNSATPIKCPLLTDHCRISIALPASSADVKRVAERRNVPVTSIFPSSEGV